MAYRQSTLSLNSTDIYSDYLIVDNDHTINIDSTYNPVTVTLPDPSENIGQIFCINALSLTSTNVNRWEEFDISANYQMIDQVGPFASGLYIAELLYTKDPTGVHDFKASYYKNSTLFGDETFHFADVNMHDIMRYESDKINKVVFYNSTIGGYVKAHINVRVVSSPDSINEIKINTVSGLINHESEFVFTDTIYKSITVQSIGSGYVILWSYVKLQDQD